MESMYSVAGYISVPDADLEISKGGGGVGGRAVIQTLLVSVWSKNKGGVRLPPGPLPWIRHCILKVLPSCTAPCTA